jgi:arylsulfatase A-like enzyme
MQPTMPARWRTLGFALAIAFAVSAFATALEIVAGSAPMMGIPVVKEILYALGLHLFAALIVTLMLRALFWRASEAGFMAAALGGVIALELSATATFWFSKAPYSPPFYTTAGRLLVALGAVAGIVIAFLVARAARRKLAARAMSANTSHRVARLGLGLAIAMALAGALFILLASPRPQRIQRRADAERLARPDVFIILIDTLRRDHVSAFGYARPTSPTIDRLCDESYVYTAAYTPSTCTIPSVASILTGLYPSAHGITTAVQQVPEDAPLLAEHFRSYGYRTAAFVGNLIITGSNGYAQGFEHFFPSPPPWWSYHQRTAFERIAIRARMPASASREWRLNQELLRWLRATPNEPHFVYLHYMDPHSPYQPAASDLAAVAPDAPPGPSQPPTFADFEDALTDASCRDWECLAEPVVLAPRDVEGMVARYDGEIHHIDRRLEALFGELRTLGAFDRGHLIFLTDHGEQFGDHAGWFHGHGIYDEMITSPMIYRPPGGLPARFTIARPTPMLDLPFTLCRALGFDPPPLHQGREIPELLGRTAPTRPAPILSELPPWLYALRLGRWKLIQRGPSGDPEWRLYDLESDPLESRNLAPVYPDTLAYLRGYLEGRLAEVTQTRLASVSSTRDPELLERLKTLGYIR